MSTHLTPQSPSDSGVMYLAVTPQQVANRGKVALVTGASRGIGRAIATRFAQGGFNVALVGRNADRLEETAVEVRNEGGEARCYTTDVTDASQVEGLVKSVGAHFGRLDVLVNNAGVCIASSIESMSVEDYYTQSKVNMDGVFLVTHFAWPLLRTHRDGVVINISSKAAVDPFPGLEIYGGTKAAVNAWSAGWAREGAKVGIRVYCIGPGATETPLLRQLFPKLPDTAVIMPEDVAELALTLAGPAGKYISGTTLYIGK